SLEFSNFIGVGSSFSPKDVLTLLSPSTPPSLPLRRRRLPFPTGSRPAKGRPPLRLAPLPQLAAGLAMGGSPLQVPRSRPPLRASCYKRLSPPTGCPQPTVLAGDASARKRRPLRSPLASLSSWPWLQPAAPLQGALVAAWREIVYPCIPDPDREDEGGQASSLVVSTRWISVAKLLQSDLATLAQREGGE
ncbi:hypothetical protein BHM03_00034548, partial [Ensete ventricosum]